MTKRNIYEIFARINRGDDLMHVGTIEAENDDLAVAYAAYIYNEEDWTDMYTVRRDHLLCVHSVDALFAQKGVGA